MANPRDIQKKKLATIWETPILLWMAIIAAISDLIFIFEYDIGKEIYFDLFTI